jgi:3-oxoacyl-[acyl-carrier-protein] synthase-3
MIAGIGAFAPEKVLSNFDLEKMVDTSDEWIRTRTGIERRHILESGLTNSDMAAIAARRALEAASVKAEELDCIITATITPDSLLPSTACRVQAKIGAEQAAAMDVAGACSGFLYAMTLADAMIHRVRYQKILVIGSEVLSRFTDWEDRKSCVLFGDGSGAVVMTPSDGHAGLLSAYIKSDGRLGDLLAIPGGGATFPASHDTIDRKLHLIHMEGQEVFKHAVRTMVDAAQHGLKEAGYASKDIDLLITHQANMRIIQAVGKRLKLPDEKIFTNLSEYGNTSSASIPLALEQAWREGRLKKGDLCLLVAFGGGFTWASTLVRW